MKLANCINFYKKKNINRINSILKKKIKMSTFEGALKSHTNTNCFHCTDFFLFTFATLYSIVKPRSLSENICWSVMAPHSVEVSTEWSTKVDRHCSSWGHLSVTAPTGNHVIESHSLCDCHFVDDRFLETPTMLHLIWAECCRGAIQY